MEWREAIDGHSSWRAVTDKPGPQRAEAHRLTETPEYRAADHDPNLIEFALRAERFRAELRAQGHRL